MCRAGRRKQGRQVGGTHTSISIKVHAYTPELNVHAHIAHSKAAHLGLKASTMYFAKPLSDTAGADACMGLVLTVGGCLAPCVPVGNVGIVDSSSFPFGGLLCHEGSQK